MTDQLSDRLAAELAVCESATIPGFPDYMALSDGRIISTLNWRGYGNREVTPVEGAGGYLKVRLRSPSGKRVNRAVHRLVVLAHLGERPPGAQIRHLNGDKTDNRIENLAWGTARENAKDRDSHGTTARGERNGFSRLNEETVRLIRRDSLKGLSQRAIASRYEVSQRTVGSVIRLESWSHVTNN